MSKGGGTSPWTILLWLFVIIIALTCINQSFNLFGPMSNLIG